MVQGQPRQNLARLYLKNRPDMMPNAYGPSYLGGRDEDHGLRPDRAKAQDPI
jgi:hypothetical protein